MLSHIVLAMTSKFSAGRVKGTKSTSIVAACLFIITSTFQVCWRKSRSKLNDGGSGYVAFYYASCGLHSTAHLLKQIPKELESTSSVIIYCAWENSRETSTPTEDSPSNRRFDANSTPSSEPTGP